MWTASVAELTDCTATGASFEELERAIRERLLKPGSGRREDGTQAQDNPDIELQWSVDETETIGDTGMQSARWLEG